MTSDDPYGSDAPPEVEPGPIRYVDNPGTRPSANRQRTDPWTIIVGLLGGALLGTGLTLGILSLVGVFEEPPLPTNPTIPPPPTLTLPAPVAGRPALPGDDPTAEEVALRAVPSIVAVSSSTLLGESSGSGVVYGSDGYIITNHHVIAGGRDYAVIFSDGAVYTALLVGSDPLTDLAVLSVSRNDLAPIDFGSSSDLAVGEIAIAVGNPLALTGGPSVTSGIVSALNRSIEVDRGTTLYGLVQTDAPITRGSSGGALLDGNARLIGITTAIAVSDVGAEGLGFAIPSDMVLGVVNDLIEIGEVRHAFVGITGTTAFAVQGNARYPVGVLVEKVTPAGPYDKVGGHVNDVVTAMNGDQISGMDDLLTRLRMHREGQEVILDVTRNSGKLELVVVLERLQP